MRAVRPLRGDDVSWVLALNAENVVETSAISETDFVHMLSQTFRATALDGAFFIAFSEDADYGSVNFRWFQDRYERFAYVDRVVVPAAARGGGIARALYEDLFAAARTARVPLVCCEVNAEPPNPASDAFHARLAFAEVGEARLANGKRVRYLARSL